MRPPAHWGELPAGTARRGDALLPGLRSDSGQAEPQPRQVRSSLPWGVRLGASPAAPASPGSRGSAGLMATLRSCGHS